MLDTTHKSGDFGDGSYFVYLITILNHHVTIIIHKLSIDFPYALGKIDIPTII